MREKRKFLLNISFDKLDSILQNIKYKKKRITKFYTKINPILAISFTNSGGFCTKKIEILKHIEMQNDTAFIDTAHPQTKIISIEKFNRNLKNIIGEKISKVRYTFDCQNIPYIVEIYRENLADLVVFKTKDKIDLSKLSLLENSILEEITFDRNYRDINLARFGLASRQLEIQSIKNRLEKMGDMELFFGTNINTDQAINAILYQKQNALISIKKEYLNDKSYTSLKRLNKIYRYFFHNIYFFKDDKSKEILGYFNKVYLKSKELAEISLSANHSKLLNQDRNSASEKVDLEREFEKILSFNEKKSLENLYCEKNHPSAIKIDSSRIIRTEILKLLRIISKNSPKKNYNNIYSQALALKDLFISFKSTFHLYKSYKIINKFIGFYKVLNRHKLLKNKTSEILDIFKKIEKFTKKLVKQMKKTSKNLQTYHT